MVAKNIHKIPKQFTSKEKKAIEEKLGLLESYIAGEVSLEDLGELNKKRRLIWLDENREVLEKYSELSVPRKAHKILFLDHMGIDPEHSVVEEVSDKMVSIKSYNFCPYLEACKILGLDTRIICKKFTEPCSKALIEAVHPSLKFSRNYDRIRPHHEYCAEFIEIID